MEQKEYDVFYDTEKVGTVKEFDKNDKRIKHTFDYESKTHFIEVLNVTWLNDYKHLFI